MAIDWKAEHQVVIVGAGLVGLALAIFLRRAGYPVTLLERDPELRNVCDTCDTPLPNADRSRLAQAYNYPLHTIKSSMS